MNKYVLLPPLLQTIVSESASATDIVEFYDLNINKVLIEFGSHQDFEGHCRGLGTYKK